MTTTEHCWHTTNIIGMASMSGMANAGQSCCWCGASRTETTNKVAPPGHGPKWSSYFFDGISRKTHVGGEHPCIEHDGSVGES